MLIRLIKTEKKKKRKEEWKVGFGILPIKVIPPPALNLVIWLELARP